MREKGETYFNNVEMAPLREAIVFGGVRWSSEMRDTMKSKKVRERNLFTTIIRVQGMDVLIEVFFYNGFKSYEYVFDLGFLF